MSVKNEAQTGNFLYLSVQVKFKILHLKDSLANAEHERPTQRVLAVSMTFKKGAFDG